MNSNPQLWEQYEALERTGLVTHFFIRRIPGVPVCGDKAEVLERLEDAHQEICRRFGVDYEDIVRGEQTHGDVSAVVEMLQDRPVPDTDGLITASRGLALGIHVADCCPVFIVDRRTPSIALVHSGRRGTEKNIVGKTLRTLKERYGVGGEDLTVVLGPCIRPPHYEVDIARAILEQCRAEGVEDLHDCGVCTACEPQLYYSYRMEKGKTGRLFAVMMLR